MKNASLIGIALFTSAGIALSGCSDNYGEACSFPASEEIEVACTQPGTGAIATCVYRRASDCSSGICALYLGSDAFCTEECDTNDDCPDGDVCHRLTAQADSGICLIPSVVQAGR